MNPSIWGPYLWYILHIISFSYPEYPTYGDKRLYHDFYVNFKDLIPCDNCKKHYNQHLHQHPITPALDTRADLIKWVIQMHNMVNISLGKPIMSVQEVLNAYHASGYHPPNYKPPIPKELDVPKWSHGRLYFWIFLFGSLLGYRLYNNYKKAHVSYH